MIFSIICLTYKRPELLEESVYSVLQQTCQSWEMLIINDCASQTIHFDHRQVRIFNLKEKFKTIADKRNFGVDNAVGDLVLQLDDDDFLLPFYLENLKKAIGSMDMLSAQRPIMYDDDPTKICLSPVPQCNTFVYRRIPVWSQHRYESYDTDEGITLNPFYGRVLSGRVSQKFMQLKPNQYGHVWRQSIDSRRKYSLADFLQKKTSVEDQNRVLDSIEDKTGDVFLEPKWSKDYTSIIQQNMRVIDPLYAYSKIKGGEDLMKMVLGVVEKYKKEGPKGFEKEVAKIKEDPENAWQVVKPTWANAFKFAQAAKSRGLLATALNVIGVNNSAGDRVSDEVFQQRKLSCFGNKAENIDACVRLKNIEKRGYFCGSCGCGNKELARLDSDVPGEYTKLHYPKLQCPLKKKGFSNWTDTFLTVIITALNEDPQTLNDTIKSIRDTSTEVDIIVIDDFSDIPVVVEDQKVTVFRNSQRIGCAPSRHYGANMTDSKYLLFTDSHMVFSPNWYESFISYTKNAADNVVFCGVCVGLDDKHRDLHLHCGKYYGARLALYEEKETQVLEGKWIPEKPGDAYEISCMMGATYFINREYFLKLRGLSDLKMWGSDEPCLSLKVLLSGGKILLAKNIEIGHIFRTTAPYATNVSFLVYNKIRMAKTLLPDDLGEYLISMLPRNGDFFAAMDMIEQEKDIIKEYKEYYKSIFPVNIQTIREKFNIKMP